MYPRAPVERGSATCLSSAADPGVIAPTSTYYVLTSLVAHMNWSDYDAAVDGGYRIEFEWAEVSFLPDREKWDVQVAPDRVFDEDYDFIVQLFGNSTKVFDIGQMYAAMRDWGPENDGATCYLIADSDGRWCLEDTDGSPVPKEGLLDGDG